jgi:uncharacterized protein YcnI
MKNKIFLSAFITVAMILSIGCKKPIVDPPEAMIGTGGGNGGNYGSTNRTPVANAGTDQTITLPANSITLDGNGSSDPDNNIVSYLWAKISGPTSVNIANANSATTQATTLIEGIYQFELKVIDTSGLFAMDTVQITVASSTISNGNNIYIAGWGNNANGKSVARIWNNNILQDLSDGQYDAIANSVYVVNNEVYVAGSEVNASGKRVAKLWKNGVVQDLSNGQHYAGASSVFVSGNDVYVAGWEVNASDKSVPKLWKNGVGQNLSDGQNDGAATSVFVSGADVYVAGWYMDQNGTSVWKNGVAQVITNGNSPDGGQSLFVSGNDVYVAMGWLSHTGGAHHAGLWKNGQLEFNGFGLASSVFVSDSDVYVAGQRDWGGSNYEATIWKNGVPQNIGDVGEIANSVFVLGSNVYAAGNNMNLTGTASLWKNGIRYSIPGLIAANSVFVK